MNFDLNHLPNRTSKPREKGITMVMDKGLSLRESEDFVESSGEYTDLVKFGFGTSMITNKLEEKIKVYQSADIDVYFGGTLFEAFVARGQFDDYRRMIDKYSINMIEVSDGSLEIAHDKKCEYIKKLKDSVVVLSEVGSKDSEKSIPPY